MDSPESHWSRKLAAVAPFPSMCRAGSGPNVCAVAACTGALFWKWGLSPRNPRDDFLQVLAPSSDPPKPASKTQHQRLHSSTALSASLPAGSDPVAGSSGAFDSASQVAAPDPTFTEIVVPSAKAALEYAKAASPLQTCQTVGFAARCVAASGRPPLSCARKPCTYFGRKARR